jgi:hypothetical protein
VIDFNKTRQYTLSIRLSADGFCFTIHNPQVANEYAYLPYRIDPLKPLTANLKRAIEETDMLHYTYGATNIILADASYTLVPKEYYAEQYKQEFYRQNISGTTTNSTIMHNVVGDERVVLLFAIDKQLHKYLTAQYPKARIYASISPLINFGVERSYATEKKYCLLHVNKRSIDFMCYENAAPLFANSFQCRNTADALYYILNCWSMLGLSQTDETLHIAGQSRQTKALTKELGKFIKNIHTIRPAEEFHSSELARIDELTLDLQTLIACE